MSAIYPLTSDSLGHVTGVLITTLRLLLSPLHVSETSVTGHKYRTRTVTGQHGGTYPMDPRDPKSKKQPFYSDYYHKRSVPTTIFIYSIM